MLLRLRKKKITERSSCCVVRRLVQSSECEWHWGSRRTGHCRDPFSVGGIRWIDLLKVNGLWLPKQRHCLCLPQRSSGSHQTRGTRHWRQQRAADAAMLGRRAVPSTPLRYFCMCIVSSFRVADWNCYSPLLQMYTKHG